MFFKNFLCQVIKFIYDNFPSKQLYKTMKKKLTDEYKKH